MDGDNVTMRYSVLTYIFNGYEHVHEVQVQDPEAEYILVTDDRELKSDTWKVVVDEKLDGLSTFDKCYQVRFNPFNYVSTDIVVRVDGSMILKDSLAPLVDKFKDYDMCLMIHPTRNKISDEYEAWIERRHYPVKQAERCMEYMRNHGYDFDYRGLFQLGFVIQRNDEVTREVNKMTHFILKTLRKPIERIDQTVFSYVVNKYFSHLKVMPVSESLTTESKYVTICYHNSDRPFPVRPDRIKPFMFDKDVSDLMII